MSIKYPPSWGELWIVGYDIEKPLRNNKSSEGNPKEASTRFQLKNARALADQPGHDKRIARQPDYIDESRKHLNRITIEPNPPGVMRAICENCRALHDTKRLCCTNPVTDLSCEYSGVAVTHEQIDIPNL